MMPRGVARDQRHGPVYAVHMTDTATAILDAAERLLGDPDTAFSLRAVAREVGITPMAVYRHHDGVEGLLDALRERGFGRLMEGFQRALAADSPRERLVQTTAAYVGFARAHPALFRLLWATRPPPGTVHDPELRRNAASFRFIVDRIREAMDADLLPDADPEAIAIAWWAQFHGLVLLHLDGKLKLTEAELDDQIAATLSWLLGSRAGATG